SRQRIKTSLIRRDDADKEAVDTIACQRVSVNLWSAASVVGLVARVGEFRFLEAVGIGRDGRIAAIGYPTERDRRTNRQQGNRIVDAEHAIDDDLAAPVADVGVIDVV